MDEHAIECDEFLRQSPEEVWRALTDPELLARWWAPGDVRPVVGHRFALDMGPWGQQQCEVLAVDEPTFLAYSFGIGTLDSIIEWRLQPEGNGTRLFLTHKGFDLSSPMGAEALRGMGQGWPTVIHRIAPALEAAA